MMLNKNAKTEGNPTLLKMQYGRHRLSRSAVNRRDSEEPEDRRLKSALAIKHPRAHSTTENNRVDGNNKLDYNESAGHSKLDKKESVSDLYSKKPTLRKASLNLRKRTVLNDSNGNKPRSTGYKTPIEEVAGIGFEADDAFDFDTDEDEYPSPQKRDSTSEHESSSPVEEDYCRICKAQGALPSGRFKRQLSRPVADMSHSGLGTRDIKSISIALTSNLNIKDLDLSGNDLSGKGASYLAEGLKENVSVNELNISECNICLDGLKALATLLLDMKPMKRLYIARNKFEKKHAEVLSEVIQKNDYIEDLDLSGNEFSAEGGVLIGKALGSNVGIKRLDLSWNHIRREGAMVVCDALRLNRTIEELDLSWNGLAEEGCRALMKSLPANHTLRELDLTCNRINVFSLRYLLDGLEKNDTLETLLVDKNPLTTEGAILLMKVLAKSETSVISNVHLEDIPINEEFLESLRELRENKSVVVHHRDPNRKKITQIVMERTLRDFDPAMILFEYMKQENLRLIDLFRVFDTDSDHTVSRTELKEGFVAINLPLPSDSLDNLFDRLDLNENRQIEYDEYKVGYRKAMNRIKRDTLDKDDKNIDTVTQLRGLIKKAIKEGREAQLEKRGSEGNVRQPPKRKLTESDLRRHQEDTKSSMNRRTSLRAVFKVAGLKALGKIAFENN